MQQHFDRDENKCLGYLIRSIHIGGDMPSLPSSSWSSQLGSKSNGTSDSENFVRVSLINILDGWNPGYFWLDTQLQGQVTAMRRALDRGGIHYQFRKFPGGRHNERAWALRIDKPLLHLFSNSNVKKASNR